MSGCESISLGLVAEALYETHQIQKKLLEGSWLPETKEKTRGNVLLSVKNALLSEKQEQLAVAYDQGERSQLSYLSH